MYLVFSAKYLAKKSPGVGAPKGIVARSQKNLAVCCWDPNYSGAGKCFRESRDPGPKGPEDPF